MGENTGGGMDHNLLMLSGGDNRHGGVFCVVGDGLMLKIYFADTFIFSYLGSFKSLQIRPFLPREREKYRTHRFFNVSLLVDLRFYSHPSARPLI